VKEIGDGFRDTVALTVRGDGVDIPPFIIVHTYKTASKRSLRRCGRDEVPVKGMNIPRMKEYIDHIAEYVQQPSLLVMDRLSSHTSAKILHYISSKKSTSGDQLLFPLLLPPKTAFLISPLDMGAIAAFKSHYHKLDRSTLERKIRAVYQAWDTVSNDALANICRNCGVVGEEMIESIRERFLKEVTGAVPSEIEEIMDYYDSWKSGFITVEGASLGRGVTADIPRQLADGELDGKYWARYRRTL